MKKVKVYDKIVINMETLETIEEEYTLVDESAIKMHAGGSGGGASGTVVYPDYMEDIHVDWLTGGTTASPAPSLSTTMEAVMDSALGASGNPYTGEVAYDPDTDIATMQNAVTASKTKVDAQSPEADWASFYDTVYAKVNTLSGLETEVSDSVAKFEANQRKRHLQALARLSAQMADINAVGSSQYIMGMALLEAEYASNVDEFESRMRITLKDKQNILVQQIALQATQQVMSLYSRSIETDIGMTQAQLEVSRMKVIAKGEETSYNMDMAVREGLWDLEVFTHGAGLLASITGAARVVPDKPSRGRSALSGALGGASIGAKVGGGMGALIGGGIGGLAGLFAG